MLAGAPLAGLRLPFCWPLIHFCHDPATLTECLDHPLNPRSPTIDQTAYVYTLLTMQNAIPMAILDLDPALDLDLVPPFVLIRRPTSG